MMVQGMPCMMEGSVARQTIAKDTRLHSNKRATKKSCLEKMQQQFKIIKK